MAAAGSAPIQLSLAASKGPVATHALLAAMLRAREQVSDLIFSPGRLPQVEIHGQLFTVEAPGLRPLSADETRRIASDLIGENKQAISVLREQGYCDVSFAMPGLARFRVNVFIQRGSCAVVMRVIPTKIPDLATLGLPEQLGEIAQMRDGIVLITGPRSSGKSSTLAALLDRINQQRVCHIITIEDPIEFLHNHKRATIHQRELHSDTPSIPLALRAALRQAPSVILLGEMRDRETMELVLEAAETGHLVLSSLNTMNTVQTVERIVNAFSVPEQAGIRERLARTLRWIVSQRLIPRSDGGGRVAVVEVLKTEPQLLAGLAGQEFSGRSLVKAMQNGSSQGIQHFDHEIEKLARAGVVDAEIALTYARDPAQLKHALADLKRSFSAASS
jgi:twitching motility protein PilT